MDISIRSNNTKSNIQAKTPLMQHRASTAMEGITLYTSKPIEVEAEDSWDEPQTRRVHPSKK